ncbi:hypothetical protein Ccrd_026705 [Cynara cardunculus var. scolymus]|uniref:Uncharacterized protein n=1 Tax=Cynara cardunculus var. scolymus TaxID=59895 RepID=A0A103L8P0_CYNCS|nr:hypothetical protein Ccrd_026705 [Cynara cardunculus var. scolymus]
MVSGASTIHTQCRKKCQEV